MNFSHRTSSTPKKERVTRMNEEGTEGAAKQLIRHQETGAIRKHRPSKKGSWPTLANARKTTSH